MSRRAFSIVELLVVIGIIGILIGLLMPTLSRARQQSRTVACKAQLQSIGAAMQMYLNSNAGWYPAARYTPDFETPDNLPLVNDLLRPFLSENVRIWKCPADEKYFPEYGLSYSYYQELAVRKLNQTFFYRVLRSSSLVPILWDAEAFHGGTVPLNWLFADGHVDNFLEGPKIDPPPETP